MKARPSYMSVLDAKLASLPVSGRVAELADAPDSKSGEVHSSCGFDPHLGHHRFFSKIASTAPSSRQNSANQV